MANYILLSAILCSILAIAASQYPPGFILIPVHNGTYLNNTRNDTGCEFSNNPEYNSHSLYVGCVQRFDRLLYSVEHFKDASWFRGRERIIQYPTYGGYPREVISAIRITDLYKNGTGGFAKIIAGGVNQTFAKIRLFSVRNRGFRFLVRIYGR